MRVILLSLAGLLLLLVLLALRPAVMLSNQLQWRAASARYAAISHPAGSTASRRLSELGILTGSSNPCQIFVGEVRSSDLSPDALRAHYAAQGGAEVYHPRGDDYENYLPLKIAHEVDLSAPGSHMVFVFEDGVRGDPRCM